MARHRAKPSSLSYEITEFRRGKGPRSWAAMTLGGKPYHIGPTADGTRREVAARILEKIAQELREDRHKPALLISITHSYLHDPLKRPERPEIVAQVRALHDLADELERRYLLNRASADIA